MMDQQNLEAARPASADPSLALAKALGQWPKKPDLAAKSHGHSSVEELARELGLKLGDQNKLTIRRIKRGKRYSFVRANGSHIRDARTIRRLHAMAVPPAYVQVRYSPDPTSHLQAVGRDAAGRLQYRYHSDWEKVREHRKAHRLARGIRSGSVWINCYQASDPAVPFGGYKMSGYGRERGKQHVEDHLNVKAVWIKTD